MGKLKLNIKWGHTLNWGIQQLPDLWPSHLRSTKVTTKTTTKTSLKFHFKPHFELCAQSVDYHNTQYWDNTCSYYFATGLLIWIPLDLLECVYSTSFCIFNLWPIWLTTRCLGGAGGTYPIHKSGSTCIKWGSTAYTEITLPSYNSFSILLSTYLTEIVCHKTTDSKVWTQLSHHLICNA
jgi:hypothetical protein